MQDDPHLILDELRVGPVIRPSSFAQNSEAGSHRIRKSKETLCLIDEMRSKVERQSCAWTGILATTLTHERSKTIDVRLIVRYFAEHT